VVYATPSNEHADLYYAARGTFSTIGVITAVKIRLRRADEYVVSRYYHVSDLEEYCRLLAERKGNCEFVEGVVFGPDHYTVIVSNFASRNQIEWEGLPIYEPLKRGEEWYYYYVKRTRRRGIVNDAIPTIDFLFRSHRGLWWMAECYLDSGPLAGSRWVREKVDDATEAALAKFGLFDPCLKTGERERRMLQQDLLVAARVSNATGSNAAGPNATERRRPMMTITRSLQNLLTPTPSGIRPGRPKVGEAKRLLEEKREKAWVELAFRHGRTFRYQGTVVTCDPQLVEILLTRKAHTERRARSYKAMARLIPGAPGPLFMDGEEWLAQAKALMPAFHGAHVDSLSQTIHQTALDYASGWREGERIQDLFTEITKLGADVALRAGLGLDPQSRLARQLGEELIRYKFHTMRSINRLDEFGFSLGQLRMLPKFVAGLMELKSQMKRIGALVRSILEERRVMGGNGWIWLMREAGFPELQIRNTVNHLYGAYNASDFSITAQSEIGAATLYHEIFIQKSYLRHGVEVSDGDCVFDVGANVGLFSIFLAQSRRGLKLFAFEPIQQTFSLLKRNVGAHLSGSQAKLFNYGLSSQRGTARFEYDRFLSPAATMYPKEVNGCVRPNTGMRDWAKAGALDLQSISKLSDRQAYLLLKALSTPVLGWVVAAFMIVLLLGSIARKKVFLQRPECQLRTVSEMIREQQVNAIDLMKIDVEGSELDVIRGIEPEDWPKIRQFVVEVHDIDGRVEAMRSIFEHHGYRTVVDECEWETLKLINNFTIFAVR